MIWPNGTKRIMKISHDQLIKKAISWLINVKKCQLVITDMTSYSRETPDAIGWLNGFSYLVECKTSKQDFKNDRKKFFRENPEYGIGDFRYYLFPHGVIRSNEIPISYEDKINEIKESIQWKIADKRSEAIIMTSAFRRIKGMIPIGVNLKCYNYGGTKNRASILIEREEIDAKNQYRMD